RTPACDPPAPLPRARLLGGDRLPRLPALGRRGEGHGTGALRECRTLLPADARPHPLVGGRRPADDRSPVLRLPRDRLDALGLAGVRGDLWPAPSARDRAGGPPCRRGRRPAAGRRGSDARAAALSPPARPLAAPLSRRRRRAQQRAERAHPTRGAVRAGVHPAGGQRRGDPPPGGPRPPPRPASAASAPGPPSG